MKVFFDDKPLSEGHAIRGIGNYTRNLLDELRKIKEINLVESIQEADVVHYPYFDLFFNTLRLVNKPIVVTIYDVIPLLYPKYYQPGVRGKLSFNSQKAKLKKVDAIVTISETSKKDIVRLLDVPAEKIFVAHLAPGKHFKKLPPNSTTLHSVVEKYNLPQKFVLYVGDMNYNKNIPNLIRACNIAKLTLVIAGRQAVEIESLLTLRTLSGPRDWARYVFNQPHPEHAHFVELEKYFRQNQKIIRLGYVSEEDLVSIYNLASVYCQPAFYEGFGLPVLEAMACSCPVVASKTQALVEIAEGAALFTSPDDPKSITDALLSVMNNKGLRDRLISDGLKHVKRFSWNKTAQETINVYKIICCE